MSFLYNTFLYEPLFNLLILIYNNIPGQDFGIAIILLTLIIRFILYPLTKKGIESQKAMAELQPKLKAVQEKYKNDRTKQAEELMKLYKAHKVNPFSGFVNLLIQIPILIALYNVFLNGFASDKLNILYSFVNNPGAVDPMFVGLIDLSAANPVLAVIAGALQFVQSKMLMPKADKNSSGKGSDFAKMMQSQMLYFLPFLTVIIAWRFPAGLPLYWIINTLFGIAQQRYMEKQKLKTENEKLLTQGKVISGEKNTN